VKEFVEVYFEALWVKVYKSADIFKHN